VIQMARMRPAGIASGSMIRDGIRAAATVALDSLVRARTRVRDSDPAEMPPGQHNNQAYGNACQPAQRRGGQPPAKPPKARLS